MRYLPILFLLFALVPAYGYPPKNPRIISGKQLDRRCTDYQKELKDVGLKNALVKKFREDFLKPQYLFMLGEYTDFWHYVHNVWLVSFASDKAFLPQYRIEHRRVIAYEREKIALAEALATLKSKFEPAFLKIRKQVLCGEKI